MAIEILPFLRPIRLYLRGQNCRLPISDLPIQASKYIPPTFDLLTYSDIDVSFYQREGMLEIAVAVAEHCECITLQNRQARNRPPSCEHKLTVPGGKNHCEFTMYIRGYLVCS